MPSVRQIHASRSNGAKSKGPVTPQGKRNSSRNSTRHGLLAETVVLENEHLGRFLELMDDLMEEHQPRTRTEAILVENIAVARWRQRRIWGMQKVAFDADVASVESAPESPALRAVLALRGSPDNIRTHELLLRYEIAFDRQISRSLLRLQQLQARELPKRTAKGARTAEEPIAPPSVSPEEKKTAPEKRTQQPTESKRPANPTPSVPSNSPEPPSRKMPGVQVKSHERYAVGNGSPKTRQT